MIEAQFSTPNYLRFCHLRFISLFWFQTMVALLIVCISFCSTVAFASFGFRVNHRVEFTLAAFPLNRANLGNRNRTRLFSAPWRKSKCWSCLKDTSLVLISAILETRFCELYEMKRFRRTAESLRKNCNEITNIENAGLGLLNHRLFC